MRSGVRSGARRRAASRARPKATYTARGGTHRLHGAGAVCHRAEQRAERSVGAGRDSVRAGERTASVCAAGWRRVAEHSRDPVCGSDFARKCCPEVPAELASVIYRCLKKNPADRYASAADVREALKTIMRTMQIRDRDHSRRCCGECCRLRRSGEAFDGYAVDAGGALSRIGGRAGEGEHDSGAAVPEFRAATGRCVRLYGFALADAIAARLARMPSLVVRPSSALMQLAAIAQMDPLAMGQSCWCVMCWREISCARRMAST